MASYDVIIKNGMVFDGKGNKPEEIDIGINGDEIKKIGDLSNEKAPETIDANGKYVCPGFIDLTNHSDTHWTLFTDPHQESLIKQGVTTIIGGSCGLSVAPIIKGDSVKNIAKWTDISKININWQTMGEFLSEIEKYKLGLNFGSFVGLNTLIDEIMGRKTGIPTANETDQIKLLLESSLKDGAFGISTNFGLVQKETFGDEFIESLFKIASKKGSMAKHHLEDEGSDILPSICHLINLSRKSGCPLHISHFKTLGKSAWEFFEDALKIIRNSREEKINLTCDIFPYDRTGSGLFMLLPLWLKKMKDSEIMEIISSKENVKRKDLIDYLKSMTLHYDRIIVASSLAESGNAGKTILEISKKMEIPPEEAVLNLLKTNDLHVSIFSQVINPEHLLELAKEKYVAFSSDGAGFDSPRTGNIPSKYQDLPHPRSFGAFPRAFRLFVKENNILSWEEAIYKMTGLPASILGINDRGIIAKNKKADIIIFNPDEINDYSTYENPVQFSRGVEYVFLNGEKILVNNQLTGKFAGRILRKK